jgi:paraquat-inducible protein A
MQPERIPAEELIACHECDLLQRMVRAAPGATVSCARCGAALYRRPRFGFDHSLPLFVAAAILMVLANAFPIVSLELQGDQTDATLLGAARVLFDEERPDVALLVLATGVLAPALQIGAALYLLIALRLERVPRGFKGAFRLFRESAPWAMVEVFALGVLVSLVKLGHVATVVPGIALWSFGVLMVVLAAAVNSVDPREIWARAEALR